MLDWQEHVAGTVPTNSESLFRVTAISHLSDRTVLSFLGRTGRTYRAEWAGDLTTGVWKEVGTEVDPAAEGEFQIEDSNGLRTGFYRLRVELSE